MKQYFHFNLILLLISFSTPKLINVVQLNRHGARMPEKIKSKYITFSGDQSNNEMNILINLIGDNFKLSPNGLNQEKLLGQYIRNKYVTEEHFLSQAYKSEEIKFFSTPTQRTIFSLQGFISGLFPTSIPVPVYNEERLSNLNGNDTIPITFNPSKESLSVEIPFNVLSSLENRMFNLDQCTLNNTAIGESKNNITEYPDLWNVTFDDIKGGIADISQLLNLTNQINEISSDEHSQISLYGLELIKLLNIYLYHTHTNLENSGWMNTTIDTVKKVNLNSWYSGWMKDSLDKKLLSSEFLDVILNVFEKGVKSTSENSFLKQPIYTKYYWYSGHDSGIVSLITNWVRHDIIEQYIHTALNDERAYNFLIPPFASSFIFELHKIHSEYHVKVLYNGENITKLLMNGKQEDSMKIADFKALLNKRINKDYLNITCDEFWNSKTREPVRLIYTTDQTKIDSSAFVPTILK